MYALKRFLAYGIDAAVLVAPFYLWIMFAAGGFDEAGADSMVFALPLVFFGLVTLGAPVVLYGTLIGLTGRTPRSRTCARAG